MLASDLVQALSKLIHDIGISNRTLWNKKSDNVCPP
jgi:hypothetical protein